ncbi:MAG: SdiA-regulated domain-containing protein [Cyclonatronaceae bacterium]
MHTSFRNPLHIFLLLAFLLPLACADLVDGTADPESSNNRDEQENGEKSHNDTDPPAHSSFVHYEVIISEVMIRQQETLADPDFDAFSGWVELHNREDTAVDLSEWVVGYHPASHSTAVEYPGQAVHDLRSYSLPQGTTIPANGFLMLWAGGREHTGQAAHIPLILPEEGARLGLYGPETAGKPVVDTLSYDALDVVHDISLGRMHFDRDHGGFLIPMNRPTPDQPNRLHSLQLLHSYPLQVSDPSGLDVDHTGEFFWTISDHSGGSICKLDRQGRIVNELQVEGDDMEGISQHPVNKTLFVAEERLRQIVHYDTLGNEIARYPVDLEGRNENDGLEGITINPGTSHLFVVNEKNPRVMMELDVLLGSERQQIRRSSLDFGAPEDVRGLDLSGLFYEDADGVLWLVSDEARAVFVLDTSGRMLAAFDTGLAKLEGIAVIRSENEIYLVSDELEQLFVYEYPEPFHRMPAAE